MKIRLATDIDGSAWDSYVLKHADGLAYHQFAWKNAVEDAYHFDARYLLAEKQGELCGVLPMIDFKLPLLGRSFVSLPYCDVGGCLADSSEIEQALVDEAKKLAQQCKVQKFDLRQKLQASLVGATAVEAQKVRMVLELPESSELLLQGMKAKLRSQVRKPGRDGLTAKLGGAELIDQFYQVFCKNMRDIGSPVHSRNWIDSVIKHYQQRARICIVYMPDGSPAAGGIILLHRQIVSIPWASSLRRYNRFNPNMLLYWTFLAFSADNGYRFFDFGRSTPGEGTYKFKAQWGANPEALDWVQFDQNGDKIEPQGASSAIRGHIEACWQRLPLSMCNFIGPLLRRYISL